MTATLYYNAVGTWSMIVPYTDSLWNQMMSGDFLVNVNWRGLFTFGGKCEQPGYVDSIPGSSGGSGSQNGPFITLSGADYLALIANRIAYPTPSALWASQTAGGADAVTNIPLETAIKHNVSYSVKFGTGVDLNLLDVIRAIIAQTNTSMGVRILRNAPAHRLTFDVYVPRDLSGKAWFSERLGNLTAVNFSLVDPTVTDALVQGAGTAFIGRSASARTQWNAAEDFLDNASETDVNILNTTAQVAILSGAVGPIISATMADTPFLTFGRDYYLGDIVTLEVRPGATYSDVITSVTLTADPAQTPIISVVPTIGNNANATATNQTAIGQLTARIRALEKKLSTK
jgi:hypothetical protein